MSLEMVGIHTGLRGSISTNLLFLVTAREVFESIRRSLDEELGEYKGKPGFTLILGRYSDKDLLLACVPPYPHALVDALRELYIFGARKVIYVGEGFRLKGDYDVLVALYALPRDSASRLLAPVGFPLVASLDLAQTLLGSRSFREERLELENKMSLAIGTAISADSLSSEEVLKKAVAESKKLRGSVAIDCCTSALYALRYVYAIDALSLILTVLDVAKLKTLISVAEAERLSEEIRELSLKLFPMIFEGVLRGGESGV
ncbi:MAG: hypothetical protein QXN05_01410 [Acidilobaceae archaeon]